MRRRSLARRRAVVVVIIAALVLAAYGVAAVILAVQAGSNASTTPSGRQPPAIPPVVQEAYVEAADRVTTDIPDCQGMTWTLLAGIGAVESRHAANRQVSSAGDVSPAILGPRLDGSGVGGNITPIYDTDGGTLDDDAEYDRAVGPLQFLPETWAAWSRDGNDDGAVDPHNVFDAALSAAAYLCGNGQVDLSDPAQRTVAITRYNRSAAYVAEVVEYAEAYAGE